MYVLAGMPTTFLSLWNQNHSLLSKVPTIWEKKCFQLSNEWLTESKRVPLWCIGCGMPATFGRCVFFLEVVYSSSSCLLFVTSLPLQPLGYCENEKLRIVKLSKSNSLRHLLTQICNILLLLHSVTAVYSKLSIIRPVGSRLLEFEKKIVLVV